MAIEGKQGFAEILDSGGKKKWNLQGGWLQRATDKGWKSLFDGGKEGVAYKLVLNSVWKKGSKVDFENQGVKRALGLIKEEWKKGSGDGVQVSYKKVRVGKDAKVWLIVAKGKDNVYLMPVVRSKEGCSWVEGGINNEVRKKIETEGVKGVKSWTEEHDNKGEWWDSQDEEIEEEIKNGFSITKKIDAAIYSTKTSEGKLFFGTKDEVEREGIKGETRIRYIGENAGILGTGMYANCLGGEAYFPLDLVILGKSGMGKKLGVLNIKKEQIITIKDKISAVIGVRLDQVN